MKTAESNKPDVASVFASCIALALLGLGCGGGKSMSDSSSNPPTSTTATIVAVLAAPGPPASLVVDGQVLAQNLSYMTSSNPLIVSSGPHQVLLQWPTRSVCNPQSLDLQPASRTTILCIFPNEGANVDIVTDDTTPAPNSMAKLRIENLANNPIVFGPYNVYLVPFGSAPAGTPFLTLNSQNPVYQTVAPGNYDVYFVTEGSPGAPPPTVLYHTGSLPLAANQNRSIYLLTTCQDPTSNAGCVPNGFTAVVTPDLN